MNYKPCCLRLVYKLMLYMICVCNEIYKQILPISPEKFSFEMRINMTHRMRVRNTFGCVRKDEKFEYFYVCYTHTIYIYMKSI